LNESKMQSFASNSDPRVYLIFSAGVYI